MKGKQYQLINDVLFRKNYDSVLRRCLEKTEAKFFLQELHDGPAGGHYAGDATAHKILRAGYYWPTLFKDSHSYVRKCQICQTTAGRQKKPSLPLQPVNIEQPFSQWGLDIIGEIVPHSSTQHKYILTATYYFTKWVEEVPLKTANSENIIEFIDQFIITSFGIFYVCPFLHEPYPISKLNLPFEKKIWSLCLNQKRILLVLDDEHGFFLACSRCSSNLIISICLSCMEEVDTSLIYCTKDK